MDDDPVRPSEQKFREIYELGFRTWAGLYSDVVDNPGLSEVCFNTLPQQPHFPPNLRLQHVQYAKNSKVCATGSTLWETSQKNRECELSSFQQQLQLPVGVKKPVLLSITDESEESHSYATWFKHGDLSYFPALVLAWAYILAARWAEVIPGCSLSYTNNSADGGHRHQPETPGRSLAIDIGNAEAAEARWWAAVLAPGEGWSASMTVEGNTFLSPWSVALQMSHPFLLLQTVASSPADSLACMAASSSDARQWLYKFCERHHILDQAHAALFAVILLPSLGTGKVTQLPTFTASNPAQSASPPASAPVPPESSSAYHWLYHGEREFDKLLTLSCHTGGIRPLLLSVFYDPRVECNTVTPWLQGTIAAIDSLVGERQDVLGCMLMKRSPAVSPLWLGATILGLQKSLVQHIRYGSIPVDLHSAAFSGTVQTFLQLPVSLSPADKGFVQRADECRLLYLSRSKYHTRVPICQWKPFGTTPVADTDIEVRVHGACIGHHLQYRGIAWDCVDDVPERQDVPTPANSTLDLSPFKAPGCPSMQPGSYKGMDYDEEGASENATRSILTWLRFDGCARHEGDIWKHEWFDVLDSEDEDDEAGGEKSGGYGDKGQVSSRVQKWRFEVLVDLRGSPSEKTYGRGGVWTFRIWT